MVNDREEISNVGVPPQLQPLRTSIKQSPVEGTVWMPLNLPISDREDVGFYDVSNIVDTHCPNIQGVLKTIMYVIFV